MLRILRQGQRWILWFVIIGVGLVFVLYLGIGGGMSPTGGPETVVVVGDRRFDARDVLRVRENQEAEYRRVLGDGFDREAASDFLDQSAAGALMRQALLAEHAERMGLRVSDRELRDYLRSIPGLVGDDGRLDPETVTAIAERSFGSLKRFEEALRDDLLARKASRLIEGSVAVSEAEARQALRSERTALRLAVARFDAGTAPEDTPVPEEDVQRVLAEESERVREEYERRRAEFDQPEEVRARHVLVRVAPEAEEAEVAEARARAEALQARIAEGADFADVALEASEDPGSKSRGGDLGFFPRGRMVKEFEDVAFTLEPGQVSEVVRSPHGFHLIRVEERRPATLIPFEEAREQIARELVVRQVALKAARERAEELAAAVRDGQSLVEAARERGLTLERPDAVRRRPDGYIPGVGAAPEVMRAAFALREDAPTDPRVHPVGDEAFVLIQLLEREEPEAEAIEAALPEATQRLASERRQAVETAWVESLREELDQAGELRFDLTPLRQ